MPQPAAASRQPPPSPSTDDYRHRLTATPLGWPVLPGWCVWVEPASGQEAAARWEGVWGRAVETALGHWQQLLPLRRVDDPRAAQVRVLRRRPPLAPGSDGRLRASHGRALLEVRVVERVSGWRLEPRVDVLLSPGQREAALEATALHELGHAFGLWGHSDDAADAMAAVPAAVPVRHLTARDRATLRWLYAQPTPFGGPRVPPPNDEAQARDASARAPRNPSN